MKPNGFIADVRAVGPGAPLRAAYEVSKRIGLHTLIFDKIVPPKRPVPRLVPLLGPPTGVPRDVADRTLREAQDVVRGVVTIFGRQIDVGERPDWHRLLHDEGAWPADRWWTIDIRSTTRRGDVKWAWELARHRHLVVLARAVHLAPGEEVYLRRLNGHLRSWVDQNPPESGVHWYSNLEIGLRAINWLQVLALAGERLDPALREVMTSHLYHAGRHLTADLPYTMSTMRNNHLLGDALGLIAIGTAFGEDPAATRWRRVGDRLMRRQLARHMRSDGSMIEDSVSYHRFVLEMLATRVALGGAPKHVEEALMSGARFLARLGVSDASVPQYGDWDEGRVVTSSNEAPDLAGTVRLAASLSGSGALPEWRRRHDAVAWHAGEGLPVAIDDPVADGGTVGGGIARAVSGNIKVWLKAGSGPSHGHADLSSIAILASGEWVVGDPGTGTYNGDPAIRDYFRTSAAHSVLRLGDEDQLVPHRAFRWMYQASGITGDPLRIGGLIVMWCAHGAYQRLVGRPRVARVVLVDDRAVTVGDWVEGGGRVYRLALPLSPGVIWNDPDLELAGDAMFRLYPPGEVVAVCGSDRPFDGWWSDTYGSFVPATRLECRGKTSGPVAWSIGPPGSAPHSIDGNAITRAECRVGVVFGASGVRLTIEASDNVEHRQVDLPR